MSPLSREQVFEEDTPTAQDIVLGILLETESLSDLMELHYYAAEPGFLEVARALAALSAEAREELRAFLAGGASGQGVRVRREGERLLIERAPR
jgi:hypothetical protein